MASEALYVLLLRLDAINGVRPVAIFLAILGAGFAFCFAAYLVLRNGPIGRLAWALTLGGAILFRVTLLPAGLPPRLPLSEKLAAMAADWRGDAVSYERFQLFDNDIWRYLWDGHVAATGQNPYAYTPAERATIERLRSDALVGTAPQVAERLRALAARLQIEEIVINTWTFDPEARRRSYTLLAGVFGLGGAPPP